MRRGRTTAALLAILGALAALAALTPAPVRAAPEETIDPEDVRPGMKGHGLTVFRGTEPERFGVEVISVVPGFLLRQDLILIRIDHPVTDRAGVIGGMSGSPIYLEGRLAGALAYGWQFGKEPVAGVTPIRNMFAVRDRKARAVSGATQAAFGAASGAGVPRGLIGQRGLVPSSGPPGGQSWSSAFDGFGIAPARTPVSLSGFAGGARELLAEALEPFGIEPVQGGGSGRGDRGPTGFVPGSAIGVQLIRGDMSATGIGTVTHVRGSSVLAFGHPMFNMGEGYMPVSTAEIHTVMASLARSNKIGSPLREAGSLIQDRQAAILARTDRRAPMIKVAIALRDDRGRRLDEFGLEVVSHRLLTPRFLQAALLSVINSAASDAEDVTAEVEGRIWIGGRAKPLVLADAGASRVGLASLTGYFRPIAVVGLVLGNSFEDARIERLEFDIRLHYGRQVASVIGAYLTGPEPMPGEVIAVHVRLQMYGGEERLVSVPIRIPDSAAGERIRIEVGGGDNIAPIMPLPQSLDDLLDNVQRFHPSESVVVSVDVPGEAVALRGRVLEQLPASAVTALKPAAGAEQIVSWRSDVRQVLPLPFLVTGRETIEVTVGNRRNR
ncbi:MAG TPA: hypothetical protein VM285_05860 [Polyangia bacterium]|nr:hypothetical protein [Polyangia bacterium]